MAHSFDGFLPFWEYGCSNVAKIVRNQNERKASEPTDRIEILAYLETDRLYAACAIGDVEPAMFEHDSLAIVERGRYRRLTTKEQAR